VFCKDTVYTLSLQYDIMVKRKDDYMAQTLINIRVDEGLKKDLENVCQELGMNMTTAFTIFAKKVTRERRIPFDVSIDPFYSEDNMAHLARGMAQMEAGGGVVRELIEVDDE